MKVKLEPYEIAVAEFVAERRHVTADDAGYDPAHGCKLADAPRRHLLGAKGEMAVAKGLNLYWSGSVGTFRTGGDVGRLQVRCGSGDDYKLLVRPVDRDTDVFVLVVGTGPVFRLAGWSTGRAAKQQIWYRTFDDRPPAFFMPQRFLRPIETLLPALELDARRAPG